MKNVLVVVDMQKDFIDGALGTKEAVAIVDNVAEAIRSFDGEVIFTRDTHFDNYMETQEGRNLPVPHCIQDTDGWQLNDKVSKVLEEKGITCVIHKPTFGSLELIDVVAQRMEEETSTEVKLTGEGRKEKASQNLILSDVPASPWS